MTKIKLTKVACNSYLEHYRVYTNKVEEINMLWQFEINLKSILLKYCLIIEQLLKSRLINEIYEKYSNADEIIEEQGLTRAMKAVNVFAHVPDSFLNNVKKASKSNNLRLEKFSDIIEDCVFTQFVRLIEYMDLGFRDQYFKILTIQTKRDWSDMELLGTIRLVSYIRNICAHNRNLLTPQVNKDILELANQESIKNSFKLFRSLLNSTNADLMLDEEYLKLMNHYQALLTKLNVWQ